MASIPSLLKERRNIATITVAIFLFSFVLILFTRTSSPLSLYQDLDSISSHSNPNPSPPPPPSPIRTINTQIRNKQQDPAPSQRDDPEIQGEQQGDGVENRTEEVEIQWELCPGLAADYIPCLDNWMAIKELKSRRHMEHRERHCPRPSPRCLVPLPYGYKLRVPWPRSRDMIWYDNAPHPKLVEYKKEQNWIRKSGDYFIFPGGGTQFKGGVTKYIQFIEQTLPVIGWGSHTRVVLDVGCGVASFGGYLLDKNVLTMSFAPKDEHEAQIQFALERGIPAFLAVIGTQRLTFADNVFDLIHCARCRVHWDADGGKPLMELNRILRPGGYFIWSATPVYRDETRDKNVWDSMVALTASICCKTVVKSIDENGIGLVIYRKPISNSCYEDRKEDIPPLCAENERSNISWYTPLDGCLPHLPAERSGEEQKWPIPWPERLNFVPPSLSHELNKTAAEKRFYADKSYWDSLVFDFYFNELPVNWSSIRNVMDMNAGLGGFAAAISSDRWVMNTVPVYGPDTLRAIFDRGLIGIYHDWCESFNTYPRTYDLVHSSFLFKNLTPRCDIIEVVAEMDRILRPGGWVLIQDTKEIIKKLQSMFKSLRWVTDVHKEQFLVAEKSFWRPR